MKKLIPGLAILALFFVSCKKDDNNSGGGNQTSYTNTTPGNKWYYERTTGGNVEGDTLISSNQDTTIGSKVYHIFDYTSGARDYRNQTGNEYFLWQYYPDPINTSLDNKYLIDNVAAGTTWQGGTAPFTITLQGIPLPLNGTITLTNKMENTDTTVTLNNIVYSKAKRVSSSVAITGIPGVTVTSDINTIYAPNYGIIYNKTLISASGQSIQDSETKLMGTNF